MSFQETLVTLESIPIACTLSEGALDERKQDIATRIFAKAIGRNELEDGYEFQFSADFPVQTLSDFIQAERQCCRFFTFELIVAPQATVLRLRGSAEAKNFAEQAFVNLE